MQTPVVAGNTGEGRFEMRLAPRPAAPGDADITLSEADLQAEK